MNKSPQRKVVVVPYNPEWNLMFITESEQLTEIFKENILSIHHIGSTAIAGLEAKPIIDILVVVKDIQKVDDHNQELYTLGYLPKGEYGIPGRRFLIKGQEDNRSHHIHIFQTGNPEIERHLIFRNYMRTHPNEAMAYGQLKDQLVRRYPNDIESYIEGKDKFIKEIDRKAAEWKRQQNQNAIPAYSDTFDQEVIELCQNLVSIQSFNPPGNELDIANFALNYLKKAGFKGELIKHGPQRASVIACLPGNGCKKGLLFSAHMDTVPVGAEEWIHPPYKAELIEGKIWGRGAADMKSGMAAILVAAKTIASSAIPLEGDLVLALSAGEEVDMVGANVLVKRTEMQNLMGMIVAEPTSNQLVIAEKGILWVEITTHGKTAHGSMPEFGKNAITMMLAFIEAFNQLKINSRPHPLLGDFSRSLNTIQGGIQTNVIPDQCKISIDMRTVPGQNHADLIRQIESIFDDLKARDESFSATLRPLQNGPALATTPNDPLAQMMSRSIHQVTGQAPSPKGVRYFTDAAVYYPHLQIPLVICGPGQAELAHQPNEYVEVNRLTEAARIYTHLIQQILQ